MEDPSMDDMLQEALDEEELTEDTRRELRGMELKAYSTVMDALRADGAFDKEKKGVLDNLKKHFTISESRHVAECRRANSSERLGEIADRLREAGGEDIDETWTVEAYGTFPPLPQFHRRISIGSFGVIREPLSIQEEPPPSVGAVDFHRVGSCRDSLGVNAITDNDLLFAHFRWGTRIKKIHKKVQTKVSTLVRRVDNDSSDESFGAVRGRAGSPDITDTPSPNRSNKMSPISKAGRKRRSLERKRAPCPAAVKINKKFNFNNNKHNLGKLKSNFPKIKFVKRSQAVNTPPSTDDEEDDETMGDNGLEEPPAKIVNRPNTRVTSNTAPITSRGRGARNRGGRGMFSRGRGRGGTAIKQEVVTPERNDGLSSPTRCPSLASSASPTKRSPLSPSKTLKVLKPKKAKPVSLSRRKSKLKEKEDDDMMQMEWNDDSCDDNLIMTNRHGPIKRRKLHPDDSSHSEAEYNTDNGHGHGGGRYNHHALENGEIHKDSPRHHPYHLSPNDTHLRPDTSQRSPQMSGEETDSASEQGSVSGLRFNESPGHNSNCGSPPPSTGRQKQRLKSPLNPNNPQLPRISIPPPVFSTSLNQNKKRPQKHVSVVDSLNLHLPTTPTASSLARRPSMGTGSSIFSNAQAMIARSGSPGILQNQRKVTPHILANSKALRSYVPPTSSASPCPSVGIGNVNVSGVGISLPPNSINSYNSGNAIVSSGGGVITSPTVVQIPNSTPSSVAISGTVPLSAAPGTRTSGQGSIILLQKTSNAAGGSSSSISLPNNTIPVKSSPRAVILRRTPIIPRTTVASNVMFLDMPNMSTKVGPSFLQSLPVSEIVTSPNDVSVLNFQGQAQVIQSTAGGESSEPVVYSFPGSAPAGSQCSGEQLAQMNADLIGMEQDIVYEEEVVTTSSEKSFGSCNGTNLS